MKKNQAEIVAALAARGFDTGDLADFVITQKLLEASFINNDNLAAQVAYPVRLLALLASRAAN